MTIIQKNKEKVVRAISVAEFYDSFKQPLQLSLVAGEEGLQRRIKERSFNRPAGALAGYFEFFAWKRIQLLGAGEMGYLKSLNNVRQAGILKQFLGFNVPCLIVSRGLAPTKTMVALANK